MIDKAGEREDRMEKSLAGKSALVTGSTSGIGRAIAERFAREGANVMLNGFGDAGEIESLRAGLEKLGVQAAYHGADMTKPAEIADLVATTEKRFGRIDILVNNAGVQHVAPIDEFPPREVGLDHRDQPHFGIPLHARRAAGHEAAPLRPHHQHRLRPRPHRLAQQMRLRGRKAWRRRIHQDRRAGSGRDTACA